LKSGVAATHLQRVRIQGLTVFESSQLQAFEHRLLQSRHESFLLLSLLLDVATLVVTLRLLLRRVARGRCLLRRVARVFFFLILVARGRRGRSRLGVVSWRSSLGVVVLGNALDAI